MGLWDRIPSELWGRLSLGSRGRLPSGSVSCSAGRPPPGALLLLVALLAVACLPRTSLSGQTPGPEVSPGLLSPAPSPSSLRPLVERYTLDLQALLRRYSVPFSPARRDRLKRYFTHWQAEVDALDYAALGLEERIDYHLLEKELGYRLELLDREEALFAEMVPMAPFAPGLMEMEESRRRFQGVDPEVAAGVLAEIPDRVAEVRDELRDRMAEGEDGQEGEDGEEGKAGEGVSRVVALRTEGLLRQLMRVTERWYRHFEGYDPLFTWWVAAPYQEASAALEEYADFLRVEVVGHKPGTDEPIVGDPIGADGMAADLAYEMIPYTPEELIAIGEAEFAWCREEMLRASRELGFGEDWKAALEYVKTLHVPPGEQPALVRRLAVEAVEFLESRDLMTIPELAKETWRLEMMSPEAQKTSPFFLGGEVIRVSFPTDEMSHEEKLQSMRGNNEHFSRATVQHELIPGHGLQQFMYARYQPHRAAFYTPFWIEGNALYWEMLLWDLGFPRGPEDRVGMLFWRMHRAARIIFSLSFHLEAMTPEEAIDFLVDQVGHERANATAEVRRSFNGAYSPLYQAAYMLGGIQLMSLRRELVDTGTMTDKQFHDAIMTGGIMPIELLRLRLKGDLPEEDYRSHWRFAGDPLGS